MDLNPKGTWVERLAETLFAGEWLLVVVTNVCVIVYLLPVCRRFRSRPLMLMVFGSALGVFIEVFQRNYPSFGASDPADFGLFFLLREVAMYSSWILVTVGTVLFLKDYERFAARAGVERNVPPA